MTEGSTKPTFVVTLPAGVCLACLFVLAAVAYLTAFPWHTVTHRPIELIMFLPALIFAGWCGMPANFFHNVGLPDTFLNLSASVPRFVLCWGILIGYWIVFASLITLSLTKRHVVTLVGFAIILLLSAHGCQSNIKF